MSTQVPSRRNGAYGSIPDQAVHVPEAPARTFTYRFPFGDSPTFANTCHACHTRVKARDFVFTGYGNR